MLIALIVIAFLIVILIYNQSLHLRKMDDMQRSLDDLNQKLRERL